MKTLDSDVYSITKTMKTHFEGSLFSACDVTGWDSELKYSTRTEVVFDTKVRITLECF